MPILACGGSRLRFFWGFWFRVFGYGLGIRRGKKLFSERNGYTLAWSVAGWVIVPLHPSSWKSLPVERPRPRLVKGASA